MKFFSKILPAVTTLAVAGAVLFGFNGVASAACQFQYTDTNFQTSTTPVFNSICGVPTLLSSTDGQHAFGDETDFVRIRPNVSGNDTVSKENPQLVNNLTAACDTGSKFDVWTFIHNDASQDFNNEGTGSAVAHNVKLALEAAGIGTTNDNFTFKSTVSADNATAASDTATLDCNGHQVKLTLVPSSVHYNNNLNQTTYGNLADSSVNSAFAIGSPVWPTAGQAGTQLGCWDFRIVVVYQVAVEQVTTPPPTTPPTTPKPPVTPPKQLPNTGAGSTIGLFAGAAAAGTFAYRWYLGRRLANR